VPHPSLSNKARRLCVALGLPLLALGPLAIFTYAGISVLRVDAQDAELVRTVQLASLSTLDSEVTQATLRLQQAALARTPAEAVATLDEVAADGRRLGQAVAPGAGPLATTADREQFARLRSLLARFREQHAAAAHLVHGDRRLEASELLVQHAMPAGQALLAELANAIRFEQSRLRADLRQIRQAASVTLYVLGGLMALTAIGLMLFADRFVALLDTLAALHGALSKAAVIARDSAGRLDEARAKMARQAP
jgi:hypothetical protein